MKVTIEIPNKFIEIAKGIILGGCTTEAEEQETNEIAERAKNAQEPILVNLSEMFDNGSEDAAQMYQMIIALTMFGMHAMTKEAKQ